MNPYLADILAQPAALREALRSFAPSVLQDLSNRLHRSDFDRILISGMGSSFNAAYPALLELSKQPVPVQLINAAELLHFLPSLIGPRTLLWLNSQSGRSAELVHLLEGLRTRRPGCILSFVNDAASPLAAEADVRVPIHAGMEATVSTKTYVNMLAVNLLSAIQLTGGNPDWAIGEMLAAAGQMESYLAPWETRLGELDHALGEFRELFLLGRGASMSAVWNGSLINKEACKCAFEGMQAADFRHGPLELVSEGFAALIFAGPAKTRDLNRTLALEIDSLGGRALWIDGRADPALPTILLPETSELALPLVEILPVQILTLLMARRKGIEAGQFRHVGKVTARE